MPRLSILIATIPRRKKLFDKLVEHLSGQATEAVEILYDDSDDYVGTKRQRLLNAAKGDYVVYVDDDDMVNDNYIPFILKAIESSPDCVGFKGWITTNGANKKNFEISREHKDWTESNAKYYRHTLHITPVKREIALKVGFSNMANGEDYKYSMGLVPLLQSEVFIDEDMYYYIYKTNK